MTVNNRLCVTQDLVTVSLVLSAELQTAEGCCSAEVQWGWKEVTGSALKLAPK